MDTALAGPEAPGVAIVTGGSRGAGRATVRRLATRGYAVVVNYVHDQRVADATVETVLADHGAAVAVRADVADEMDVQRLFAETIETFGGVDAVVHTVGSRAVATTVTEVELDYFDTLFRINTRATLIVNREGARCLRPGGAIVNLCGTTADSSLPAYGLFAATTAATVMITRALALELRDRRITVNAISLDAGRPCTPGRVADVVAYLLSDPGHGLTGQVFGWDGATPPARLTSDPTGVRSCGEPG